MANRIKSKHGSIAIDELERLAQSTRDNLRHVDSDLGYFRLSGRLAALEEALDIMRDLVELKLIVDYRPEFYEDEVQS